MTGVCVRLQLAQDTGQALKSPGRVGLVRADRPCPSLGELAESCCGATQVAELLQVPGQVAYGPEGRRMVGAEHLLTAVE